MINARIHPANLVFDQVHFAQKFFTEIGEVFSSGRHPQAFVHPLKQRHAKTALGLFDAVRQGGGGQPQFICRIDNPSRAANGADHLQMADIKARAVHRLFSPERNSSRSTLNEIAVQ
ncbi:MAG: hypothetical protein WAO78_08460 [Roseovarius sp.]